MTGPEQPVDNLPSFGIACPFSFCNKGRGQRREIRCFPCVGFHIKNPVACDLSRGGAQIQGLLQTGWQARRRPLRFGRFDQVRRCR